ncbi:MAG: cupredoxin domain-containing protein [Actinomycetota bacterium]
MRSAIRCLVIALALVVIAPPVGAQERGNAPRAGTQVARVRIVDFAFRPRSLTIDRGTVVRWVNRGSETHTTTSNTGTWDSGRLSPGDTFRRRFRSTGTFRYHCTIHTQMTATIIVN